MPRAVAYQPLGLDTSTDIMAYLLGLGRYAYSAECSYGELYHRLHQVIREVAHSGIGDREREILCYGAQISPVDRVLAALFVAGARECLAASRLNWFGISEETTFQVALEQGKLADYVSFAGHFAVPAAAPSGDSFSALRARRYRQLGEYFLSLPEGPTRQGLRLTLLSLFDRTEDELQAGFQLCDQVHLHDARLASMVATRLLLALERGEMVRFQHAYRDLSWQMVAMIARWGIVEALPHLRRLLAATPPRDRDSRVLRANLQQAIDRLSRA